MSATALPSAGEGFTWKRAGAYTVRVRVEAPLVACPLCGGELETDEACEMETPIARKWNRSPVMHRRIVRAVLCTRCEFCQEAK